MTETNNKTKMNNNSTNNTGIGSKGIKGKALKTAFPHTIPVMTGYVFLGITYGILMVTNGFPFYLPTITALIIYTGSMEFLMVDILLSSFNPLSAFVTALMVGSRHLMYGLSMLKKYSGMGRKKFYLIYTTSDETFAVNYTAKIPDDVDTGWFYFWVSLLDQSYWVLGSLAGGIFGSFITFNTKGLDFVMTAMFITILMNQWLQDGDRAKDFFRGHISEFVGLGASVLCLILFGADHFIVPTMIVILVCLLLLRKRLDTGNFGNEKNPEELLTEGEKEWAAIAKASEEESAVTVETLEKESEGGES